MTDRVSHILRQIQRLTALELADLLRRLNDEPGGTAGVREPRTPSPRSGQGRA